ncbi:MAG: T9SS type A sorting domain-containing protein [Saprospiraceae bacterium]|nr:T9SS type A sorting domain-containing protein [Saprospiraceae bacterium]
MRIWIDLFLRELKLRNLKPDWIGFHVFSNDIDEFYNAALNYRKLLRSESPFTSYASVWGAGDSSFFHGTELICDAWGFDNDQSLPDSTRDSLFNKQRGAAHHVGVFIALQHADIERAYIYRGGELGSDTSLGVMGLFQGNADGAYKPVAYGFKLCSKMQTTYNKKLTSSVSAIASGGSKIWTLAGEDSVGNKAILISNPTANTINLTLKINNIDLNTSMYSQINQYTVTDSDNGETPVAWTNGAFELPAYTSHLITMTNTSLSISEQQNIDQNIRLYPNPTNGIINFSETLQDVQVYTIYGQLVFSQTGAANFISVEGLSDGVYFIHTKNAAMKFIVKK